MWENPQRSDSGVGWSSSVCSESFGAAHRYIQVPVEVKKNMANYRSVKGDAESLCKFITSSVLKKVAFERYKIENGTAVNKVMPGSNEHFSFSSGNFEGVVDTSTRELINPVYDGIPITANNICARPESFSGIANDLFSELTEVVGDVEDMYNPPEKGESQTENCLTQIKREHQIVVSDPMLDDLIATIRDKNYQMSAKFLNVTVDNDSLLEPGGSHELTELFTNGEIDIVERYRYIALLKPNYRHDVRQDVKSQQAGFGRRVRYSSQPSELAFVVGVDDTPTGLFAHSVDGTNLSTDQSVSKSKINDVMGFDKNYQGRNRLDIRVGERIRLQGDFAIEYLDESGESKDTRKLNLPIDNHLCNIDSGYLPEGEDRESEPIEFVVPTESTLNMIHNEHDDVNVKIPKGRYRIYLLPRGIKENHPRWV